MAPLNFISEKYRPFYSWMVLFLLLLSTSSAFSQIRPSLFIVADFMKVQPGKISNYLDIEQTIWKPLHAQRVKDGIIVGWYLYAVNFVGTDDDFNYVVITLYDNQKHLENPWPQDILSLIHPKMEATEIMERTNSAREHRRSELFYSIVVAPEVPLAEPAPYLQVNYMQVDPGNNSAYQKFESDIWQPVHEELVKSGRAAGWGLWALLFPRGAARPYQYCTLNAFSDFSYVFELEYANSFSVVHPDKDINQIWQEAREIRTTVRTELWELIDYEIK